MLIELDAPTLAKAAALIGDEQRDLGRPEMTDDVAQAAILIYLSGYVSNELAGIAKGDDPTFSSPWRVCLNTARDHYRNGGMEAVLAHLVKMGIRKGDEAS